MLCGVVEVISCYVNYSGEGRGGRGVEGGDLTEGLDVGSEEGDLAS